VAKRKCPEFENHERWLVSYADMVTLLFAVFVVLYSLNLKPETAASDQAAGSMQESFNKPLDDIPVERRIGPTEHGIGIFDHFRGNSVRPPLSRKYPSTEQRVKDISDDMRRLNALVEQRLYGPSSFPGSDKSGEERIVSVQRSGDSLSLRMLARHFFAPGEYQVRREALGELDKVIGIVKELGRPVVVEGHTDNQPPSGRGVVQSNWELSSLRASYVLRYMIRDHHFPATKLSAAGYADLKPVAHNGSETGRSLNRRIEMKIRYDEDSPSEPN
jgi:chemotaxis protein MotB